VDILAQNILGADEEEAFDALGPACVDQHSRGLHIYLPNFGDFFFAGQGRRMDNAVHAAHRFFQSFRGGKVMFENFNRRMLREAGPGARAHDATYAGERGELGNQMRTDQAGSPGNEDHVTSQA